MTRTFRACLAGAALLLAQAVHPAVAAPSSADVLRGKQAYEKKDYKRAFTELSEEAKRGKPEAMHLLGMMYAEGQGVKRDDGLAFGWFEKASQANYAPSQGMLGMFFAQGRSVERDNARSVEWTRRAADNGDALSQYMMGVRALDGLGIPKKPEEALIWFGSAAEQNYGLAQYAMGMILAFGPSAREKTPEGQEFRVEGTKWMILAVKQKQTVPELANSEAKLAELKKTLSPQELAAAQKRAAGWRPIVKRAAG